MSGDIDYLPFIPNPDVDIKHPSSFGLREVAEYMVDYEAEVYRRSHKPTHLYPSRLGCVYAFGSREDALMASKQYGYRMSDLKRFVINFASEPRVVKVNMQVVTQMWDIGPRQLFKEGDRDKIWAHYWSGGGALPIETVLSEEGPEILDHGVIWEYLIDGQVQLAEE